MWLTTASKGCGEASFVCKELWNPWGWRGAEHYTACCERSVTTAHGLRTVGGGTGTGAWLENTWLPKKCKKSPSEWSERQFGCVLEGLISTQQGQGWRPGHTSTWVLSPHHLAWNRKTEQNPNRGFLSSFSGTNHIQIASWATSCWDARSGMAKCYFSLRKVFLLVDFWPESNQDVNKLEGQAKWIAAWCHRKEHPYSPVGTWLKYWTFLVKGGWSC